jgi:hypothetical protein
MNWEEIYRSATLEVDPKKMPVSIADSRRAIQERLSASPSDHTERDRLEEALRSLTVLENESSAWPGN